MKKILLLSALLPFLVTLMVDASYGQSQACRIVMTWDQLVTPSPSYNACARVHVITINSFDSNRLLIGATDRGDSWLPVKATASIRPSAILFLIPILPIPCMPLP